ncbi:hypothetical protein [Burkholderia plantarii]|uniref:hypothetical protein n=1 Tax=Burkholderia plantarii TaxID=41899 RepID=UPI0007068022|nr:hypothetical protein [Burkholderia plantarii]ALK30559.1 hypothetical protein bpln_1g17620 [Burkholderia plantarii]GLZ19755.1 hypothetical protein Bpla01_32850 [Burkholderia plantarii]
MTQTNRPILKLPSRSTGSVGEQVIVLDSIDVLLPCRRFTVSFKVSERGSISPTSEFLLRLLHAADGILEADIASFFGFNQRELSFVLEEVTSRDYVSRSNGQAWLTPSGQSLFLEDQQSPAIYAVEKRTESVSFDLLSLCPVELRGLGVFAMKLDELPVLDVEVVANARQRVPKAFRTHFSELFLSDRKLASKKPTLYSIDHVAAGDRFSTIVPITVTASTGRPHAAEADLSNWREAQQLEDRYTVVESVTAFMETLKVSKRPDDIQSYQLLTTWAPDFLREFMRRDGLAVERYFHTAAARAGELRSDRPTVPLLGTLFTSANNERLHSAVRYALERCAGKPPIPEIQWIVPEVRWGHTRALPATLNSIAHLLMPQPSGDAEAQQVGAIAISRKPLPRYLAEAFDHHQFLAEQAALAPSVEVFLIPGLVAAVLVHAPIKANNGIPVPLGFLSFDASVVQRVMEDLAKSVAHETRAGQ